MLKSTSVVMFSRYVLGFQALIKSNFSDRFFRRRNTNREKTTLLSFKIVSITGIVLKWAGALVKTVDKELIISHLPVLVSPVHREVKNTDGTCFYLPCRWKRFRWY